MNIDTRQIRKAQGFVAIILGVLLAVIPLSFLFRAFGFLLLLIALPNFFATISALSQKNLFVTVVFVKSLLLLVLAVLLIALPEQSGAFCIVSGIILLIGTTAEYGTSQDKKTYLKKEYWLLIVSAVLIILGGFSFITAVINIIKYILAGLIIIYGLVMIITTKPAEDHFEETLRDYERRYQEQYGQEPTNEDIIEATYEENEYSNEE